MKYLLKLLIAVCILTSGIFVHAQNAIPATGGNASGAGGTSSYTIGQVFYRTISETSGTITQGVQQPYEILVVTSVEKALEIILECSVYPNPATEFLTLRVKNYDKENLTYRLYDIKGTLIENTRILDNDTQISMVNLTSGTYLLKITDNKKEVKTFKIIKN